MKFGRFGTSKKELHAKVSVTSMLAVAGFLIFVNIIMFQTFAESRNVRNCHAQALAAAEDVAEDVNAADYYEFAYRTCMRALGEAL